eukprot:485070_1
MSLHYSLSEQSKTDKEWLVFGYRHRHAKQDIVWDIIHLCLTFYDEVSHWIIYSKDLIKCEQQRTFGKIFACHGVHMRCSFSTDAHLLNDQFKSPVGRLNLHVDQKDIESFKLYVTVFCPQNDAHFKRVITNKHIEQRWENSASWSSTEFPMLLDCNDVDRIDIYYHIDMLSIKYKNEKEYHKPISIKRDVQFTWHLNGVLLHQMRNSACRQMFYSQPFDEDNQNWALCLFPKGLCLDAQDENRKSVLVLRLFKVPHKIESLKIRATVTNSYNHLTGQICWSYDSANVNWRNEYSQSRIDVFASTAFSNTQAMSISIKIEILEANAIESKFNHREWQNIGVLPVV